MVPFALRSLDAQLAAVESPSDDDSVTVPKRVADCLIKHRDIILAMRQGADEKTWSEDIMPYSVKVLEAVPDLLQLPPMEAARAIADEYRANGDRPVEIADLQKRVDDIMRTRPTAKMDVSGQRRRAFGIKVPSPKCH